MAGSKMKASLQQLLAAYKEHNSVWKVAEIFGMCGQSVHERLKRYGVIEPINILTDIEKQQIKEFYEHGFETGDGKLKEFAVKIKRTVPFISRYAKSIFLSNLKRKLCEDQKNKQSEMVKESIKKNGHPRGMLGKKKSEESRENQRIRMKERQESLSYSQKKIIAEKAVMTRRKNGTDNNPRGSWKASWRTIGDKHKFFRSRWEANYARYLENLKKNGEIKEWFHEPETFWFLKIKRGSRSYLPDFKVIMNDDSHYWVEVKGYMCARSLTKIKRFRRYFPKEKLIVVQKDWFKENSNKFSNIIPGWECGRPY